MKWYIVRHAEKEKGDFYNPVLRHQDEPISQRGLKQAEDLWEFFATRPINSIYISQYQRTGQTIQFVTKKNGLHPIVDDRLNEIDNGLIDSLQDDEIQALYPEVWNGFKERNHDFKFPQGESGEDARRRIASFMAEKMQADRNIIVVCHEGLIRLWVCHLMGLPVYRRWDFKVDFCGITEIEFEPEFNNWRLIRFNQTVL